MKKKSPIVEVTVASEEGRVAVGIMNADQALELADTVDVEVSHPDHKAGETEVFIGTEELRDHPSVVASSGGTSKADHVTGRSAEVSAMTKAEKPGGIETEAALRDHLSSLEADAPAEEEIASPAVDYVLEDDDMPDEEGSIRRLQDEIDNLRARLHIIREQAGTVVSANAKWADASAHEQLGDYPWAKLGCAMAFTFVAARLLRRLPLGAVASAALPIAASQMRRRYER